MQISNEINKIISNLSIEQKLSQLFISGYSSIEPNNEILEWCKNYLGGIILFRNNIVSPTQIAEQIEQLQKASPLGLFVSVDQEGGLVERITGVTQVPSFRGLANTDNPLSVEAATQILAEEIGSIGFNLNFSPVMDVNTEHKNPIIGIRSFGENPDLVTRLSLKVIETYRKNKIIPVAKHFPGHGSTTVDSHLALPSLKIAYKELENIHLKPFVSAIQNEIEMIMVSHVYFKDIIETKNLPASLSKAIISDLLIKKLNYKGIVITDDLYMNAITNSYPPEITAELALNAGVDILLYKDHEYARLAYDHILKKVTNEEIDEKRIDQSLTKILDLKQKYSIKSGCYKFNKEDVNSKVSSPKNMQISNELFASSVSIIKSSDIHFSPPETLLLYVDRSSIHHYYAESEEEFSSIIGDYRSIKLPLNSYNLTFKEIESVLSPYDRVIVISYNAIFNKNQENLIRKLTKNKKFCLFAAGSPYDLDLFQNADLLAAGYGYRNAAIASLLSLQS